MSSEGGNVADAVKKIEEATQKSKLKTYQVDPADISELSFIQMQLRASEEVLGYWNNRLAQRMGQLQKKLSIPAHWEVQWDSIFTEGKIFALPKPEPKPTVAIPIVAPEKKEEHGTSK